MTARYDYTPDPQAEIVLVATFEGSKASGEWTMVPKGQDGPPFSAGTWQVEKK